MLWCWLVRDCQNADWQRLAARLYSRFPRRKLRRRATPAGLTRVLMDRVRRDSVTESVRAEGHLTLHDVGAIFGRVLVQKIGQERYDLWFTHTKLTWEADRLTIGVPNRFFQEWLEGKFRPALLEAASQALGRPAELAFAIDAELFKQTRAEQEQVAVQASPAAASSLGAPAQPLAQRRRWFQLDDFVVGACNRMAHAAAMQLAERPDVCPNPTVFCGPPGVGKTHLLEGLAVEMRKAVGEAAVICLSAEEFTNQFLQAMRAQQTQAFRKQFREVRALCVDDVHFFAKKRATQEEFLHTFEALRRLGRPVIVTTTTPPDELPEFMPELRDRLRGGGVWAVDLPDMDTRKRLLELKAAQVGLVLPNDVLADWSVHLSGNVRELQGALHRLHHQTRVNAQPVNAELARLAAGPLLQRRQQAISLTDVERALCAALGLDARQLRRRSRSREVSHPRMLAAYLARKHTAASYVEISQHFGGVSHTTAITGEKKVKQWLAEEATLVLDGKRLSVRVVVDQIAAELASWGDKPARSRL